MGKITGFMEFTRELPKKRKVEERIGDYKELYLPVSEEKKQEQADTVLCNRQSALRLSVSWGVLG